MNVIYEAIWTDQNLCYISNMKGQIKTYRWDINIIIITAWATCRKKVSIFNGDNAQLEIE